MPKLFRLRTTAQCVAAGVLLLASVAPQAGMFDGVSNLFSNGSTRTTKWLEHPEKRLTWPDWDYVQMVPREANGAPNQQPVSIAPERVYEMLARVVVMDDDKAVPLFSADEMKRLAPVIAAALAKLGPDQELAFETTGPHAEFGPLTRDYTNAGRIFFADGKLNVLFGATMRAEKQGNVHVESLANLPNGTRASAAKNVELVALRPAEGVLKRADWVALSTDATPVAPVALAAVPVAAPMQPATTYAAPVAPVAQAPMLAAPQSADNPEQARMNKLETRLMMLKRLHDQGLLTDAEFEQKRVEVVKQM